MTEKRRPLVVRAVLIVAGVAVTLTGVAGLALPVIPGWALIFAGLAILATEFVWARTLLDNAKAKAGEVAAKLPTSRKNRAA
jgi:uncharacterized protein (TIGR02611 family)